jgi:hypothetical protein
MENLESARQRILWHFAFWQKNVGFMLTNCFIGNRHDVEGGGYKKDGTRQQWCQLSSSQLTNAIQPITINIDNSNNNNNFKVNKRSNLRHTIRFSVKLNL